MDLQNMQTAQLMDHYKDSVTRVANLQTGHVGEKVDKERNLTLAQRQADRAEEEILRRMAW